MDSEERIKKAVGFFGRRLDRAKEEHGVLDGEATQGDESVRATLGGWFLLSVTYQELMEPRDDDAFRTMLESQWGRAEKAWVSYHRKHQPRRGRRQPGDRLTGRRPSGRSS
jgi:hypothetical protein